MNSSKQIKFGAVVSYFTIAFNMIAGLIYTPWMITQIGQNNYGLYTLATSLITMFVMDFGMSAATSRFISKYNAEGNQDAANNFLGVVYKLYLAVDAFNLALIVIVSFFIENIYTNLSATELETFKVLYAIVGLFTIISFPFTNQNGVLTAYEKFVELKIADLFHKVFIVLSMVVALYSGYGVYALVIINAIAGILTIAIKSIIIHIKTPARANFKYRNKNMLKEVFGFSMWTTISSLALRLIFNITPSLIAAVSVTGSVGVAIFGLAQTIEGYIFTFANAINGMFMARISKYIYEKKKDTALMDLMIKVGRLQCMVIGILVFGFVSFGKSFIVDIWGKPDFAGSYLCAVFIIIPSYIFLPLQIANTTMIVENKVKMYAMIHLITGIINVILSLILSKYWGALGASISIFIVTTIRTVMMVTVHIKVLHLDMWRFFRETFIKITPFLLITMCVGLGLEYYNPMSAGFMRFVVNGIIFVLVFAVTMLVFVMNKYEKDLIFGTLKKVLRKFKLVK